MKRLRRYLIVGIPAVILGWIVGTCFPLSKQAIADNFHNLFYKNYSQTWNANTWMGVSAMQNPNDVWIIQEILWETMPDVVVEIGAMHGGGALTWASILSVVNPAGRVITVDIVDDLTEARKRPLFQEKIEFIKGSSTSEEVFNQIKTAVEGKKSFFILDSNHEKSHVLKEMLMYGDLVNVGGYMLVQDSNVNGHPADPGHGPGPYEAIEEYFASGGKSNNGAQFEIDKSRERLIFTMHPNGYLKRVR